MAAEDQESNEHNEQLYSRRKGDQIGIVQLFHEMQKLQATTSEIKTTVENGIKKQTKNNTKTIKNLCKEIGNLKKKIDQNEAYEVGQTKTWQIVLAIITSIGGGIVGTITVLSLLKGLF